MIPLLGRYSKKPKILIRIVMCTSTFMIALFTIAKIGKQHKWIKKLWSVYTMKYYPAMRKIRNNFF